jgi:release factor glutamine methyltransferase
MSTPSVRLDTSLDIDATPDVYDPSNDSYLLLRVVDVAREVSLLEMGTGTGLIAIHAAKLGAKVTAADINPHAVECARRNAAKNNVRLDVVRSDLFEKIHGSFDIIAFNPPYLPAETKSTAWIEKAWSGGEEGGEVAIRFLQDAWKHLNPGGRIYMILSSVGGLVSALKAARERYEVRLLEEQRMFFESIYAYEFRFRSVF